MTELVRATIERDTALEQRMLEAVIADRNDQPRNKQVAVGPSSIGFCRELLRAQLFEGQDQNVAQEENWATAAHWGTVLGQELERIFGERLSALEQQRVTAWLASIGVSISGAMDLVFLDDNQVTDLKSTTDIGGLIYDLNKDAGLIESLLAIHDEGQLYEKDIETPDGGYELTTFLVDKISKLQYYVQIAIYVTGAMQSGVLDAGAEGRLVFYDRAGDYADFVALRVTAEMIDLFFEIGQHRVAQVATAQELLERTGNAALIHQLRDKTPSFCFSPKVMCPMRDRCWGGSKWDSETPLEGAELSSTVDRYIEGRRLKKMGEGMTKGAREELKGIEGKFKDGRMVTWSGNTINVVETAKGRAAAKPVETPEVPRAAAEALADPQPQAVASSTLERDPRLDAVKFRDSETGAIEVQDLPGKSHPVIPESIQASTARLRAQQDKVAADRKARAARA